MYFFCFRTTFPVLECPFPVFWESDFVPGCTGTEEFVPGRDAGQGNFFVPGQRDNGTSRPGLSRDVPRDVPSLGNPSLNQPIVFAFAISKYFSKLDGPSC